MRRAKKSKRHAFSASEIADFARLIRVLIRIQNRHGADLLEVFALLQRVFPKLRFKVVANDLLPRGEARAYPKSWIIKISQGVFDGLLRGHPDARWTFAHELGHVLLRHPGEPFRDRISEEDVFEREAHIFAAELLSPSEHVSKLQTPEEAQKKYQISSEAAQRRIDEVAQQRLSQQFGTKRRPPASRSSIGRLEDYAAKAYSALTATIEEFPRPFAVRPFRDNIFSSSVLVAKGAQLLLESYESVYGAVAVTETIRSAALVAAIVALRPICCVETSRAFDNKMKTLNERCALRAVVDTGNPPASHADVESPIAFPPDYLNHLKILGERLIADSSSAIHFFELPSYYEYNAKVDVTWTEIHALTRIANLLLLLKGT